MTMRYERNSEWLETDGLGGFASGTARGIRTRRYHALLLDAATPPTGRAVLVNGFEAWVETPGGRFAITSQAYAPDVVHPDGATRIDDFAPDPWPRWTFRLDDGTAIEQEIFAVKGAPIVALRWRLLAKRKGISLRLRPLLSGRDVHALHRENPVFRFAAATDGDRLTWRPYPDRPGIVSVSNGTWEDAPDWYRNFSYAEERDRGFDHIEDLASPGLLGFDLSRGEAIWILAADRPASRERLGSASARALMTRFRAAEARRRKAFPSRLHRAADAYLVARGEGRTVAAGYPWFGDRGRDTFVALRGLALATGRLDDARAVLLGWAGAVSGGLLPDGFPEAGGEPGRDSADASLWYVIAAGEWLAAMAARKRKVADADRAALLGAIEEILDACVRGTRHGIRLDADGLLAAGEPGLPVTWMDAKIGDRVVTPRIGKPVEVQALWLNALKAASRFSDRWEGLMVRGLASFTARFWNETAGCLFDVVDVNHEPGTADATFRPNQILAAGGLPLRLLDEDRARAVVDAVEARLLTPLGLRSLAPGEAGYAPRCEGGAAERDGACHQGTAWPWLLGPFVEAWVRARGDSAAARRAARERFLAPLLAHLDAAGLGHVSEIADAEAPHAPRGCPFQAWSVGEALRLDRVVLAEEAPRPVTAKRRRPTGRARAVAAR